jgi:hypothetical protein
VSEAEAEQPVGDVLPVGEEEEVQGQRVRQAVAVVMQDRALAQVPVAAVAVELCYYFHQQF